MKLYKSYSNGRCYDNYKRRDRTLDVRENGDSTARRWLDIGIDKPSCVSERTLWRSTSHAVCQQLTGCDFCRWVWVFSVWLKAGRGPSCRAVCIRCCATSPLYHDPTTLSTTGCGSINTSETSLISQCYGMGPPKSEPFRVRRIESGGARRRSQGLTGSRLP